MTVKELIARLMEMVADNPDAVADEVQLRVMNPAGGVDDLTIECVDRYYPGTLVTILAGDYVNPSYKEDL